MDCLLKDIGETIQLRFNEIIENYTLKICQKYNLNYNEVLTLLSDSSHSSHSSKTLQSQENIALVDANVINIEKKVEPIKCKYVFTKGEKQGQECSQFVKDGTLFCGKHKPKEKKIKVPSSSMEETVIKTETETKERKENTTIDSTNTNSTNTNSTNTSTDTDTTKIDVFRDVNVTDSSQVIQKVNKDIYGDPWVALQTLEVEKILEILQRTPEPSPKSNRKRSANDSKELNKGRKSLPAFDNDSESEIEEEM